MNKAKKSIQISAIIILLGSIQAFAPEEENVTKISDTRTLDD